MHSMWSDYNLFLFSILYLNTFHNFTSISVVCTGIIFIVRIIILQNKTEAVENMESSYVMRL